MRSQCCAAGRLGSMGLRFFIPKKEGQVGQVVLKTSSQMKICDSQLVLKAQKAISDREGNVVGWLINALQLPLPGGAGV